jgi:hypothetical protein
MRGFSRRDALFPWASIAAVVLLLVGRNGPALEAAAAEWAFGPGTTREIELPPGVMDAVEFGELEYDGPPYRGLRTDLDGDGALEYIVESARSLCGNGGCVYALFDGATLRPLGSVFGGWLVVRVAPAGAFPVITALSHLSAEAATHSTFVYGGDRYVQGTSVEVRGAALERLVQELRQVPAR